MWGWETCCYLFLGGLAAGLFVFSSLLQLAFGFRFIRTVRWGTLCALACLLVGVALLLVDVSQPLRALSMASGFGNIASSWMARGAWILLGCGILYVLFLILAAIPPKVSAAHGWARSHGFSLNAVGLLGLCVSLLLGYYTGALLVDAEGVPAWRAGILPWLFLASSLAAGGTLELLLFRGLQGWKTEDQVVFLGIDTISRVFLVIEFAALVVYLIGLSGGIAQREAVAIALRSPEALAAVSVFCWLLSCRRFSLASA